MQDDDDQLVERERKQFDLTFPFFTWNGEESDFPPHRHDCFEMMYVRRGHICASIDNQEYEADAGDLLLINSGAIHGFLDHSSGTSFQGFQVSINFFGEDFIDLRDMIFDNSLLDHKQISEALFLQLQELLDRTVSEYAKKEVGWQLAVKSDVYMIMLLILRIRAKNSKVSVTRKVPHKAKGILIYVLKNFDNSELTLEEAAEVFSMNKYYFSRYFKKNAGQSFHSYLTKTRVTFSKQYLIDSEMPIIDVAFNSGFGSLQTFNRVFKTMTGHTPSEWRRENSPFPSITALSFEKRQRS